MDDHNTYVTERPSGNRAFITRLIASWWVRAIAATTVMLGFGGVPACVAADAGLAEAGVLEQGFRAPPESARPFTLWHWMNGHVSREKITKDLVAMKHAGLGGFMLWNTSEGTPPGPVAYMSSTWWSLIEHTLSEAERLGLKMGVFNCAGWATSGGPWITPDRAMQEVVWTEKQVVGPMELDDILETPTPALGIDRDMGGDPEVNKRYFVPREQVRGFYRDIAVWAFPTPQGGKGSKPFRLDDWRAKAGFSKLNDYTPDSRLAAPDDCLDPNVMINLTSQLDNNGHLRWKVPPGEWTVLRVGYQPTGRQNHPAPVEGRGLEVDKMSAAAVDFQSQHSIAQIIAAAGARLPDVFHNVHLDSYEAGHQNWTASFPQEFRTRRGYDLTPYLPVLTGRIVENVETSERFLWDFRKTISDLMVENYYGRFQKLCAENHLTLSIEPYGLYGNTDDFAVVGKADVPTGEFWPLISAKFHHASTKMAASAAHTYGHPIIDTEAFTGDPRHIFEEHPYALKAQGDYFFCQGANRFTFHTFVHNPYSPVPGFSLGAFGSRIDPNNTWWPFAGAWFEYLTRCQYVLRQGQFVADMLYFTGEDAPQAAKPRESLTPQPPEGYDYDFCNSEILDRLKVRGGRLVLPTGMSYQVMVLPPRDRMSLAILRKIETLVAAGATVVGPKPVRVPGINLGQEEVQLRELADQMWSSCDGSTVTTSRYKLGQIYWGRPLADVLKAAQLVPDFSFVIQERHNFGATQYAGNGIEYIHRKNQDGDVYFVSNQHHEPKTIEATFRTNGRFPELWHADTGKMEIAPQFHVTSAGTIAVTLDLDPAGSVFVVFRRPVGDGENIAAVTEKPEQGAYSLHRDGERTILSSRTSGSFAFKRANGNNTAVQTLAVPAPIPLDGPWHLAFPPGWGAPAEIEMPKLTSWTDDPRPDVKYYSGTATYRMEFDFPVARLGADWRTILDLGNVQVIARLRVNGRDMGVLWKAPFETDVTDVLSAGRNQIEVQVANLWVNRILGDQLYPDDVEWTDQTGTRIPGKGPLKIPDWVIKGTPRPSPQRKTFTGWLWPTLQHDKKALLPSGLIGPVRLVTEVQLEIK